MGLIREVENLLGASRNWDGQEHAKSVPILRE
jgi:hypothetical protein